MLGAGSVGSDEGQVDLAANCAGQLDLCLLSSFLHALCGHLIPVSYTHLPAQRDLIGKVNLATQIILNLGLCYGTLYLLSLIHISRQR